MLTDSSVFIRAYYSEMEMRCSATFLWTCGNLPVTLDIRFPHIRRFELMALQSCRATFVQSRAVDTMYSSEANEILSG